MKNILKKFIIILLLPFLYYLNINITNASSVLQSNISYEWQKQISPLNWIYLDINGANLDFYDEYGILLNTCNKNVNSITWFKEVITAQGTSILFFLTTSQSGSYSWYSNSYLTTASIDNNWNIACQNLVVDEDLNTIEHIYSYYINGYFYIQYNYWGLKTFSFDDDTWLFTPIIYELLDTAKAVDLFELVKINTWNPGDPWYYSYSFYQSFRYSIKQYLRENNIILYADNDDGTEINYKLKIKIFWEVGGVMIFNIDDFAYLENFIYNFAFYTFNNGDDTFISLYDTNNNYYAYSINLPDTNFYYNWPYYYHFAENQNIYKITDQVALDNYEIVFAPLVSFIFDWWSELFYTYVKGTDLIYSDAVAPSYKIENIEDTYTPPVDIWTGSGTISYTDEVFEWDTDGDGEVWIWEFFSWIAKSIKYFFEKILEFFSNLKDLLLKFGGAFTDEVKTFSFINKVNASNEINLLFDNVDQEAYNNTTLGKLNLFFKWFIWFIVLVIWISIFIVILKNKKND